MERIFDYCQCIATGRRYMRVLCCRIYTSLLLLNKDHPNDLLTHMQHFPLLEPSVEISQCGEHDDVDRLLIVFEFVYTPE